MRHSTLVGDANWLWDFARGPYNGALQLLAGTRGLPRNINGTDLVRVDVLHRDCPENYEPEVWRRVMSTVRSSDVFVDVGAFIGLYAVAIGKRLGSGGQVIAFEPNPRTARSLRRHVELNRVDGRVQVVEAAVADRSGRMMFTDNGIESHLVPDGESGDTRVAIVTLDEQLPVQRVDLLKIDVEGHEERVLAGARRLLADAQRRPRAIFIEVHPFAWPALGATSAGLLGELEQSGYSSFTLDGEPLREITAYGEIVARPSDVSRSS